MSRNETSHFANVPHISIERSTFPLEQNHKTTFNVGQIIPFFTYTDVLPGDTFKISLSQVIRLATPLFPTMDNLYLDVYFFYDRTRNVWSHFKNFMGENDSTAWYSTTEYNPPKWINSNTTSGYANKTYWDYMGLRTIQNKVTGQNYKDEVLPNAFALRSLIRVYNYFFRDQNVIAPITENTGDSDTVLSTSDASTGGVILKASRFHDYFSSCLPSPQKGPSQNIVVGASAPIVTTGATPGANAYGKFISSANNTNATLGANPASGQQVNNTNGLYKVNVSNSMGYYDPNGTLIADLTQAVGATVNALRLSIQTQKILETEALNGTRFDELVYAHFSTTTPDSTIARPEYIGGKRIPIEMQQIANTTGTSDAPQGHLSAYSQTVDSDYITTKSFTEWGTILGIAVVRASHSYSQGISRMWTRNHRLEYYWPTLAHLGEQPVYNYEIFMQKPTGSTLNQGVFGYQERWAEYRYLPDITSAEMRPDYPTSLDAWHYGDDYASLPVLSANWLEEPTTYVARTLAVQSHDQLIADFNTSIIATRPMPVYSVPGLMDHF